MFDIYKYQTMSEMAFNPELMLLDARTEWLTDRWTSELLLRTMLKQVPNMGYGLLAGWHIIHELV